MGWGKTTHQKFTARQNTCTIVHEKERQNEKQRADYKGNSSLNQIW